MSRDKASHYNAQYRNPNYFAYREWLYDGYVSALIRACGLKRGASVLDVGCGQGFFSYLFQKHGMTVHGVDISEVGIRAAEQAYGHLGIRFEVADVEVADPSMTFDCVFVRGLSLYNRADFPDNHAVTKKLLQYVRPGGVLLFLYHSNLSSKRSESWRYHSWQDLQKHFCQYPTAELYFSFKLDACVLGAYAFTGIGAKINILVSKLSRRGGDLICIVRKPDRS